VFSRLHPRGEIILTPREELGEEMGVEEGLVLVGV